MITILNWGNRKMVPFDPNSYYRITVLYSEYVQPNNPLYLARFKKWNEFAPLARQKTNLEILSGKGLVKEIKRTQIDHQYIVEADTSLMLSENTYYFPGWKIYVNNKLTSVDVQNTKSFGTQVFTLKRGIYLVIAKFEDTPVRTFGKIITLTTILIIVLLLLGNHFKIKSLKRFIPKL